MKDLINVSKKIKLVVFNEYCLGYMYPDKNDHVYVLRDLCTKGAPFCLNRHYFLVNESDSIRLANANDFDEYRVVFNGYNNPEEYEFEIIS